MDLVIIGEDKTHTTIMDEIFEECLKENCAIWFRDRLYTDSDNRFDFEIPDSVWSNLLFGAPTIDISKISEIDGIDAIHFVSFFD